MKLSTRTRYGIRAVLELAEQYGKDPLQLKHIAKDQEISIKYLEQLMTMLKSAGIVSSLRGSRGGYILSRPPNSITLSDCFTCLEGPVIIVECVQNDSYCHRSSACAAREVWAEVDKAIMDILQSTTLEDVISKAGKSRLTHYQI
jgi:Rrf2 family transcriptional regulator, cysteine metabolism repressor